MSYVNLFERKLDIKALMFDLECLLFLVTYPFGNRTPKATTILL